jgi:hypothetical protein
MQSISVNWYSETTLKEGHCIIPKWHSIYTVSSSRSCYQLQMSSDLHTHTGISEANIIALGTVQFQWPDN